MRSAALLGRALSHMRVCSHQSACVGVSARPPRIEPPRLGAPSSWPSRLGSLDSNPSVPCARLLWHFVSPPLPSLAHSGAQLPWSCPVIDHSDAQLPRHLSLSNDGVKLGDARRSCHLGTQWRSALGVSGPRLSSAALTPGNFGRSGAHPATLLGRSLLGSSAALGRLRLPAVLARFGPRPLRSAVVHDVVHVFCSYNCACC